MTEYDHGGLLGCDAVCVCVWTCRWVPTFQRNMLSLSSLLKSELLGSGWFMLG
jgi:hypothetical protein